MISYLDNKTKIIYKIEKLRNELIKTGTHLGLSHPDTVDLSQKLDRLLNEYKKD